MSSQSQRSAPQTTRVASTESSSPFVGETDSNSDVQSTLTPPQTNTCSSTPVLDKVGNTTTGETERDVYLRAAQDVVTQSNEEGADDPTWHAFNADNQGVYKDDPNGNKPDAWKRGIELDQAEGRDENGLQNYTVKGKHDGETGGIDDIQEFRDLIKADLNFNDAFSKFPDEAAWIDALVKKHCPDAGPDSDDRKRVAAIGGNLWSYAMTGADKEGNTDIAELQGMLYGLDALLAEASQSNTPHEGKFTIPGTDIELDNKGDGIYGRGSELEARLLGAVVEAPEEEGGGDGEEQPKAYDQTHLVADCSGSMRNKYPVLVDALGRQALGPTKLGTMRSWDESIDWTNGGAFDDPANVLSLLQSAATNPAVDPAFKSSGYEAESSITKSLELLRDPVEFPDPVPGTTLTRQIVCATDENDVHGGELQALKDLAIKKQVDVWVVFLNETQLQGGGGSGHGKMERILINDLPDAVIARYNSVVKWGQIASDPLVTAAQPIQTTAF